MNIDLLTHFKLRHHRLRIWALVVTTALVACGTAPPHYATNRASGVSQGASPSPSSTTTPKTSTAKKDGETAKTADSSEAKKSTDSGKTSMAPTTGTTTTKAALRLVPNAAEKASMTTLYAAANNQGGCVGCHGALATSAKKGRSAAAIAGAMSITAHATPASAGKWPKDTADSSDDGIDNAMLLASAMAEVLK